MSSQSQDLVNCPHCSGRYKRRGLTNHIRVAHRNVAQEEAQVLNPSQNEGQQLGQQEESSVIQSQPDYLNEVFQRGFGAPLLNSEGSENNVWHMRWLKITRFKGNQYTLPQGAVGRHFVDILTKEIHDLTNGLTVSERILMFCSTVLQKDKMIKSSADIRRLLQKRMDMWNQNLFEELLDEATRCNRQMKSSVLKNDEDHKIRVFTRLVLQGKLRDATRWITDRSGGGVLHPDEVMDDGRTVSQILDSKHPEQKCPEQNMFEQCDTLPVMVDIDVSAGHIEKVTRSMRGGAGPSGTDADQWKSMLLRYGTHSSHLRDAVASLVRYLSNGIVPWNSIRALLGRRGVALNKCPGVRPIGVGEVLQRICAKTMAFITGEDLSEMCGAEQLCAGTKGGIEGAIHAISELFEEDDHTAVLLVDAANAFNAISRPLSLWNARIYWPRCARFLFNTYRGYAKITFRNSDHVILSQEGTTQGDPLAMLMYAVGVLPLIKSLKSNTWKQNWYADDSACCGNIQQTREWFDVLCREGPKWGYFPEPSKCVLVVKPDKEAEARSVFHDLNVSITTSHRFLGGFIGPDDAKVDFVKEKISAWIECVKKLSSAAKKSPQAAYTSFTKSLQAEWIFIQRVIGQGIEEYQNLLTSIRQYFTPAVFGQEISDVEHELFELANRNGGLNIKNPVKTAETSCALSKQCVKTVTNAIKQQHTLDHNEHISRMKTVINEERSRRDKREKEASSRLIDLLPAKQKRPLTRIVNGKASQWLTVNPTSSDHFDLSPVQFRDALSLRYGHNLRDLPQLCDGCGSAMDLTHALNCKKGGLVKYGHDQHRDHCAAMANLVWNGVGIEPEMREGNVNFPALFGDFKATGVWEAGRVAFFDNRIVNADAPSYASQSWLTTARQHAAEKHRKYDVAAEDLRGSFTPLVCSVEGVFAEEYECYLRRMANVLSVKWFKAYSVVLNWIKAQEQFSIIRSVSLRLRGGRKKISGLPYEDGAGVPVFYV